VAVEQRMQPQLPVCCSQSPKDSIIGSLAGHPRRWLQHRRTLCEPRQSSRQTRSKGHSVHLQRGSRSPSESLLNILAKDIFKPDNAIPDSQHANGQPKRLRQSSRPSGTRVLTSRILSFVLPSCPASRLACSSADPSPISSNCLQ
jgi:hypothetical protein